MSDYLFHVRARSEGVLGAIIQVSLELTLKSFRVGVEFGEFISDLVFAKVNDATLLVLQNVEGEACKDKVSDCHFIADNEPGRIRFVKLFLDNGKELCEDTILPGLQLSAFLRIRGENESLCNRVECISVGFDNHIDHSSSFPVLGIIVSKLNAKLTEDSIGLLACFTALVDNRHATELTSVSGSLTCAPCLLADINLLIRGTFVLQKHNERTRTCV